MKHAFIHITLSSYTVHSNFDIIFLRSFEIVSKSALTHVLPLVNKRFNSICSSRLWVSGMKRLVDNQPDLWGHSSLVEKLGCHCNGKNQTRLFYINLFHEVLQNEIMETLPLMQCCNRGRMSNRIHLGEEFQLHVIEKKHQDMIAEIMSKFSSTQVIVNGSSTIALEYFQHNDFSSDSLATISFPTFAYLFSNQRSASLMNVGDVAIKVQIRNCLLYPDGSFHLRLLPVCNARIQRVWEPARSCNVKHLNKHYECRVIKMGKEESDDMVTIQIVCTQSWKGWIYSWFH